MKKGIFAVLLLMLFAVPCLAAKKAAPKPCKACTHKPCATHATTGYGIWNEVVQGFELQAGFRWETTHAATTCPEAPPPPTVTDPFFIGAGLRLPLAPTAGVFGNFDRDFVDAPHWQARVGLYFQPWRKP